jgi:hypothetical protein
MVFVELRIVSLELNQIVYQPTAQIIERLD